MDSPLTFSDQEIKEELSRLGYDNIPHNKLKEFQRDLNRLVEAERSRSHSNNSSFSSGGQPGVASTACGTGQDVPGSHDLREEGGAGDAASAPHFKLRREDLDQHDQKQWKPEPRTAVPGHFALYELPHARVHDVADSVSEADSEIRRMKRKTLRKNEEGAKFIDESMSDIDAVSVSDTHERMQRMVLRDLDPVVPRRSRSAHSVREPPPPYRLSPDDPRPPSVIYPSFDHPHTKNLRRADPVARFHQMRQCWALQQAPGENERKGLRWNVREQMLTQFMPEKKPQRKYVANNYVPPPDKKRSALRWQVRMDMAQGTLPISGL